MSDQLSKAESRLWQAKPIMAGYFISGYLIARGDEEPIARTICRDEADDEEASELIVSALNHIESADISKVVEARQIIDEFIQCSNVGRWDGKLVNAAKDWLAATDRLESATTPAGVGDNSRHAEVLREIRDTEYAPHDEHGGFSVERKALSAAITALTNHATLARQLAEQRDYADKAAQRVIAAEIKQKAAESQLAEATRRLGEVKKLVERWRDEATGQSGYWVDALRDCAGELNATLTKEPAK